MTIVIRDATGEIKTFMETAAGLVLQSGESLEEVDVPFGVYARRLRLCAMGRYGELVRVPVGDGTVTVTVECPGEASVTLDINGLVEDVPLVDGTGTLTLGCDTPGTFIITPADREKHGAVGEAVCVVEVSE